MSESAPKILTPEYYERLKAVEEQHPWPLAMRRISMDLLRRCTDGKTNPRVLDAGCGAGLFLHQCGEELRSASLTGFDLAIQGLRIARRRGLEQLSVANAEALPFPSREFDVVVCHDVLQHLTTIELRQTLSEFARVLHPDGRLLIRTAARRGLFRKTHQDSVNYRQWVPRTLTEMLSENDFEPEFLARVNWLPGLLADLRALGKPRPEGDVGLALDPADGSGWKGRLLSAYWAIERKLVLQMHWRPGRGHTLFCLARKRAPSKN